MLICTLRNTKARNVNLAQYIATNGIEISPLEYFDTTGQEGWFLGTKAEIALKKKIEANGKPLKDWDVKINYGIKTGLNEAFIIDEAKKNELIAKDPKSAEIIKPILRGRDIKRYGYEFAGLYVINAHNGYKKEIPLLRGGTEGDGVVSVPPININDYPAIKEHLDSFEPALSNRQDKGVTPYNLRNCAYLEEFEKEKVVWPMVSTSGCVFNLTSGKYYLNNKCYLITGSKLKYFLGLLNSSLSWYYFYTQEAGLGVNSLEIRKEGVENVPIPTLDTLLKQEIAFDIEYMVDQILELKASDPNADTTHQEQRIDQLVFELYGLGEGEIEVVVV